MTKQRKIMYGVFGVLFAFILLALGLIQNVYVSSDPGGTKTWNIAAFEQKNNWTHFEGDRRERRRFYFIRVL